MNKISPSNKTSALDSEIIFYDWEKDNEMNEMKQGTIFLCVLSLDIDHWLQMLDTFVTKCCYQIIMK